MQNSGPWDPWLPTFRTARAQRMVRPLKPCSGKREPEHAGLTQSMPSHRNPNPQTFTWVGLGTFKERAAVQAHN